MKTSQYLIALNPMLNNGRIFIVHTREPLILCEAHHFKLTETGEFLACINLYDIGVKVEYPRQLIYLGVDHIGQTLLSTNKVDGILKRMGDWYHAYLSYNQAQKIKGK